MSYPLCWKENWKEKNVGRKMKKVINIIKTILLKLPLYLFFLKQQLLKKRRMFIACLYRGCTLNDWHILNVNNKKWNEKQMCHLLVCCIVIRKEINF